MKRKNPRFDAKGEVAGCDQCPFDDGPDVDERCAMWWYRNGDTDDLVCPNAETYAEAVKLAEEGVVKELERLREAVRVALVGFGEIASAVHEGFSVRGKSEAYTEDINAILAAPPPEIEEVEVVRWSWGGCLHTFGTEAEAAADALDGARIIKLVGIDKRPKPQPVERTVSVPCRVTGYPDDEFIGKPINLHSGERLYAFAEEDECHGKTGTLTFTWTEDPK